MILSKRDGITLTDLIVVFFIFQGGVVLLFLTLFLQTGFDNASKKLSIDVGGAKRLHSLSTFVSGLILLPWALFLLISKEVRPSNLFYISLIP